MAIFSLGPIDEQSETHIRASKKHVHINLNCNGDDTGVHVDEGRRPPVGRTMSWNLKKNKAALFV